MGLGAGAWNERAKTTVRFLTLCCMPSCSVPWEGEGQPKPGAPPAGWKLYLVQVRGFWFSQVVVGGPRV